ACPAVGRPRAVAVRAHRDAAGRVVADVAVDVTVDEILRGDDELAQRAGELVPIARVVEPQERLQRGVVGVERRPAEGERIERRRLRYLLRSVVDRVDAVGDERPVAGDADVQQNRRRALDGDRFGDDGQRLERAAELGGGAGGVQALAIEIFDVRGD